jgi:hypothetical protein
MATVIRLTIHIAVDRVDPDFKNEDRLVSIRLFVRSITWACLDQIIWNLALLFLTEFVVSMFSVCIYQGNSDG